MIGKNIFLIIYIKNKFRADCIKIGSKIKNATKNHQNYIFRFLCKEMYFGKPCKSPTKPQASVEHRLNTSALVCRTGLIMYCNSHILASPSVGCVQ